MFKGATAAFTEKKSVVPLPVTVTVAVLLAFTNPAVLNTNTTSCDVTLIEGITHAASEVADSAVKSNPTPVPVIGTRTLACLYSGATTTSTLEGVIWKDCATVFSWSTPSRESATTK